MAPIPERRSLRRELRSGFYRRLWNSTKASPSSLDGVARCAPDTAPTGPLTQHSGLSRAQQLIILSTLKLPVLPIVFQQHGGVSLDRALPLVSSYNWWSAMLLRIKLQQYLVKRSGSWREQVEQVGKGEHYSVCLKGRGRLGSNTTIDARAEAQSVSDIHRAWTNRELTPTGEFQQPENRWEGLSARVDFTHKLKGHRIVLGGAVQDRFQCQGRALCVPGILSAEVASDRRNLHYKIGVHEVFGDTTAGAGAGAGQSEQEPQHLGGHYVQGGVGIDGVLTICGGNRRRRQKRAKPPSENQIGLGSSTDSTSTGSSSDEADLGLIASTEEEPGVPSGIPRGDGDKELRNAPAPMRGGHVESDSPNSKTVADSQRMLRNLTEQIVAVKQFSKDLLEATQQVRTGSLVRMLANDCQKGRRGRHRWSPRFFLPNPHLKVGGLIGVTGSWRIKQRSADSAHSHVDLLSSASAGPSASSLRLVRLSAAKDAAAKVFLGGSVSAQIGHMKRPLLNFSSLLAQLELGIPVPWLSGQIRRGRMQGVRSRQNLTAGITKLPFVPILNLSVVQQVIGPVRVKADYKFSLDSRGGALGATNRGPMGVLVDHVQNIQPCLLDVQYGADISIPGTHGAVRFGGWYAPSRKEGMLEFRMM